MSSNHLPTKTPTEKDAAAILKQALNEDVKKIVRFPTGSQHYVFDVLTKSNKQVVVRIGIDETRGHLAGAVYWNSILLKKGAPLSQILFSEVEKKLFDFPVIIMEKLKGNDLGYVYTTLSRAQRKKLAVTISSIQRNVSTLPQASGYGYAKSYTDSSLESSWLALIESQLQRSKNRTIEAKIFKMDYLEKVAELIHGNKDYLLQVPPTAFLDDTTTKNVLIENGSLSGIVDVDFVCFGDPLYVVSLTNMALLSSAFNTDYVTYWSDDLNLTAQQKKILKLYTIVHCIGFMSELGHKFNKEKPIEIKKEYVDKLKTIFDDLIFSYNRNT